uniref:C2H2-type domain-containing protein n=1 Tax=Bursaphelenchus xylophilus TaxID=6326 RepID=A0A1I7RRN3_BURXY
MASAKTPKNGVDKEETVVVEPIHIDPEAVRKAKEQRDRLQSQESMKSGKGNNSKNRRSSQNFNGQNSVEKNGDSHNANERRQSYNRHQYNSQNKSIDQRRPSTKSRTLSKDKSQDGAVSADEKKRNRSSTTASEGRFRNKSYSVNSNGESFEYDDYELEEPFSDSEDEESRGPQKPSLIIPRGRIRTLSGTVPPVGFSPKWGGPTMCLSCLQFFDLPDFIEKFSDHLLTEHKILIEEMELIVDPKRYVEHWRQRFAKQSIADIFPKIEPKEGDPHFGKVDYYFQMSERIPEDYSLRQRLAMRRLEEALSCQQRERDDTTLTLPCIFCRYVARGNRSKIIHHLYMIHHLNLGSPDNLVFVNEYIEHLREKMQRNECIFCEKTFPDRNVLMEHMRKRNHREVNPSNNYYDKFYIINYLELGKRWLEVLAEDFEDTMPTFVDSDDEEEEESWHEWQEDNTDEDQLRVVCLFCTNNQADIPSIAEHMKDKHDFDVVKYIEENKLDFYERAKLLNFLRKKYHNPQNRPISADNSDKAEIPEKTEWDTEENLVPFFGNDHLVWMLESYLESKNSNGELKMEVPEAGDAKDLIDQSKQNTVDGVVAEDLPDLAESVLAKDEFYKTLS